MSQDSEPPDPHLDAPTTTELEGLELFRRSPHPYLRHRNEIPKQSSSQATPSSPRSRSPFRLSNRTTSTENWRKRRKRGSQSPSESGTEADDEGCNFVKALPAPPLRLHKGLRESRGSGREERASPLLTPSQIDEEGRKFSDSFFDDQGKRSRKGDSYFTDEERKIARQKYFKRRRHELLRRTTETALLAGISLLAIQGCNCWTRLLELHHGMLLQHGIAYMYG